MRTIAIGIALIGLATAVNAQQTQTVPQKDTTVRTYTSATDVTALIGKQKNARSEGTANPNGLLLSVAPYKVNLQYHNGAYTKGSFADGAPTPSLHEHNAEFFYVVEGSGTFVTGGKLVDEKRTDASTLHGSAIESGNAQHVVKGDYIIVPAGTAHWISKIDGDALVFATMLFPKQPETALRKETTILTYTSATDVTALIAKIKSERKAGKTTSEEPLLEISNFKVNLQYHESPGAPSSHAYQSEFFYVVEGSGRFVTGGKLVDEKGSDPAILHGSAIEGGTSQQVTKGDYIMVPAGTAHWISSIDGGDFVLASLLLPRPVPAAQ